MLSRILYDIAYIDSGCSIAYVEETDVDNTFATFFTNYVIAVVCFISAARLRKQKYGIPMTLFFFFTGLGYGTAGIAHQIFDRNDNPEMETTNRLVAFFSFAGNQILLAAGILWFTKRANRTFIVIWSLCTAASMALWYTNGRALIGLGIVTIATTLLMIIVFILQARAEGGIFSSEGYIYAFKSLSMIFYLLGLVVQVLLSPLCGSQEDCFRQCPLPAPTFNHNALFHILAAIGFLIYGVTEYHSPDVIGELLSSKGEEDEERSKCLIQGGAPDSSTHQSYGSTSDNV